MRRGPDLLLDMAESANEFRFLPDTGEQRQWHKVLCRCWSRHRLPGPGQPADCLCCLARSIDRAAAFRLWLTSRLISCPPAVLRPQEGNVELSMWLVQDAKHGLTLPLVAVRCLGKRINRLVAAIGGLRRAAQCTLSHVFILRHTCAAAPAAPRICSPLYAAQVNADRDLRKGEELVARSCRDTATRVRAAAEAARQAAARAAEELEKIKKGVSPSKVDTDKVKRAEKEAEQAEAAADEAAEVEADQLPGKAVEQLLPSGWRQHTLDVFFQRHAELAAKLAGGKAKDSKPQQLKAALAAALERYYGGSTVNATEEEQDTKGGYSGKGSATKQAVSSSKPNVSGSDGSSDSGSDNGKSGGSHAEASALRELHWRPVCWLTRRR